MLVFGNICSLARNTLKANGMDLILASQSPRRRRLLSSLGVTFRCLSPDVEELSDGLPPHELVLENARRKWHWCCEREPEALILTADTAVDLAGDILGKPRNRSEAEAMLRRESGCAQLVHTGYVLGSAKELSDATVQGVETSEVTFRELSEHDIQTYLDLVRPYDRAGAYDIDESGDMLVSACSGSRSNVIGLPLERMREILRCYI